MAERLEETYYLLTGFTDIPLSVVPEPEISSPEVIEEVSQLSPYRIPPEDETCYGIPVSRLGDTYLRLLRDTLLISELPEGTWFNKNSISGVEASVLHAVDNLYKAMSRGYAGANIRSVFPTIKRDSVNQFVVASEDHGLVYEDALWNGTVYNKLVEAGILLREELVEGRETNLQERPQTLPMPGFGIAGPIEQMEHIEGGQMDIQTQNLASSWAGHIERHPELLEGGNLLFSNLRASVNIEDYKLQLNTQIDGFIPIIDDKGNRRIIVEDFSTREPNPMSPEQQELRYRQAQAIAFIAQTIGEQCMYVDGRLNYYPQLVIQPKDLMRESDILVTYVARYFDPETGEVNIQVMEFDRADFLAWLAWYAPAALDYRPENKRTKRKVRTD